jgi:S-DNA-T family DNA segregation ATPase FtsK/SpoIIIE
MTAREGGRPVDGGRGEDSAEPTGPASPDGPVFEAEILTDLENEYIARRFAHSRRSAVVRRRPGRLARRTVDLARRSGALAGHTMATAGRAAAAAWRSEQALHIRSVARYRTRKAPLDVLRLIWFAIRGHARWIGKAWTFFTYGDLRADARAARLAGDSEARRKAQEMIRADSLARWARLAIALERGWKTAGVAAVAALALWLIDSMMSRAEMWPWLAGLYDLLATLWTVATVAAPIVAALAALGWLVAAVYEGRDKTPGAGFLVRPDRDDADSWVDERMISQALAHLGISPLDRFFKDGGQLVYTVPARADGNGTYAQVRLPLGVTADMVADRRDRLAANLGRAKLETWPTEGAEAGQLDLWVADKGKLGHGAGPWPLLHDGEMDIFDGVPFGRSQRGQLLHAPIVERNYLIGGQPGQGKTSAARTLCLGCALDPTVELRVYVFASNPDFDPFAPRLSAYVKGDDDDTIEAGLAELHRLREEVTRRGKLLERRGVSKVTRKLASTVPGLHPVVVVFDECHEMFEHGKYGGQAETLAIKVIKKARKCGITMIFLTQSPTAKSIPKDLTRNCSNGVAFAVADQPANDGLLGTGKYRQGIRATELRPGEDRGTAVTVGLTANRFELVNTFYVAFDEDRDEVSPVITRAMALLEDAGRTIPTDEPEDNEAQESGADHLADIHAVVRGETRVRTQVVLRRLAELNPDEYEGWSFHDLRGALAEGGVAARKSDGVMVIRAADIARALAEREEDELDDDE